MGGQLSALPGTQTPCRFWCPNPRGPLGPPGGETGGHPKRTYPPVPSHPFRQAGWGAGTYRAEPAWPEASGASGAGPAPGAAQEEHGGGTAQAHSLFLKGLLLLREEAANGEDKAEVR